VTDWRFELVPTPSRGARGEGYVAWDDGLLTGWEWPYIAVNGAQPGPAVLVLAGVHGSEYVSIDAAIRLAAGLDPAQVHGQVLVLPLVNPPAFWERTPYVCPLDGLNPNRQFPGKREGTFSERLTWHITEHALRHADALIDLHGGDIPEALVPFTIYEETGDAGLDGRSRGMAEAFGIAAMLAQPRGNSPIAGTSYSAAAQLGIPAIIAEEGGIGTYDSIAAARMAEGAANTLRFLGALPGGAKPMPMPRRYGRFHWRRTRGAGFFRTATSVGEEVAAGAIIGTLHDFFGRTLETVSAEASGTLLFLVVSSAVKEGGLICAIGTD
jgi:predicted deacylase